MQYNIFITKSILDCLNNYFDISPFSMQAAFALAEINERPESNTILLSEFRRLCETDYERHECDGISFYSRPLLNVFHEVPNLEKLSFIYIHSHCSQDCSNFENDDHRMIFRISYAYIPFGVHASLFYMQGELSGKIWLPTLRTQPLNIIYE